MAQKTLTLVFLNLCKYTKPLHFVNGVVDLYIYKGLERLMLVFFVQYFVNFYALYILQWLMQLLLSV